MPWTIGDLTDFSKLTTDKSSATTQFMNDAYRQVTVLLGQTTDASQQGTAKTNESVTKPTVVVSTAASGVTADGSNKTTEGTAVVSDKVINVADATAKNSATATGGTVGFGIESANQTAAGTAKTNESVTKPTVEISTAASKATADGSSKATAGTAAVSNTVANTADATGENSAKATGGTVASGIESANQTGTKQTAGTHIRLSELDREIALCNSSAEATPATKQALELPDLQKIIEAAKKGAEQGAEMYRAGKDKAFCPTVLRKPQGQQLEQQNKQNQNT